MKNKIKTHFYVKKSTIYLRVTINGERAEISTNKKVNPSAWNKISERVSGNNEVNAALNNLISKVEKYFSFLDMRDEKVYVHQIISELKGTGVNQMTLFKAYEYHIVNITKLIGIDYTATTIKRYKSSFASLKRYLENTDIKLCDLNHEFISEYYSYIKTNDRLQHNSATNIIKNLYRVINVAVRNNWLTSNPFKNFSCNYVNPTRHYLTESEIDTLVNKVFTIDRLTKVRDAFVFQIYTGLSFSDMDTFTIENIEVGVDNKEWIVINRRKTGIRSAVPILPRALGILHKYNYKLPVCTNQRMNGYLKEIADLCNISKPLTTHIARHTFATTITLSHGVPIETVSKMLGHSDIKTTQIYAKVVDRKVAYLNNQKGELIKANRNIGNEYPHLIARNPKDELLYIWVKTEMYPTIPGISSIENHEEVIKLSNKFKAIPVFAGMRLTCVSTEEKSIPIYGAGYVAEFTGFKAF